MDVHRETTEASEGDSHLDKGGPHLSGEHWASLRQGAASQLLACCFAGVTAMRLSDLAIFQIFMSNLKSLSPCISSPDSKNINTPQSRELIQLSVCLTTPCLSREG